MNIFGLFQNFALVEFRTKWIQIKQGPGVHGYNYINVSSSLSDDRLDDVGCNGPSCIVSVEDWSLTRVGTCCHVTSLLWCSCSTNQRYQICARFRDATCYKHIICDKYWNRITILDWYVSFHTNSLLIFNYMMKLVCCEILIFVMIIPLRAIIRTKFFDVKHFKNVTSTF